MINFVTQCLIPFQNMSKPVVAKELIASYLNYGLLLWGKQSHKVEILQKKAIRLITGSNYIAHTNPLFGQLKLLKIRDMFKLRLLKLYYKLCHNLLPSYFNRYQEIIELQFVLYDSTLYTLH